MYGTWFTTDETLTPREVGKGGEEPEGSTVEVREGKTGQLEHIHEVKCVGPPQLQHHYHIIPQLLGLREREGMRE